MDQDRLSSTRYLALRAKTFHSVARRNAQSSTERSIIHGEATGRAYLLGYTSYYKITVHSHSPYYDYVST